MTFEAPQGGGSNEQHPVPPHPASPYNQSTAVATPPPPPATKKARNTIGLIALIVAAIGFVFACIPGALIVGWILLPIGFILAIVSLFQTGKGKGLGIAALIVSIVGTIVGFAVFFAVVASSFNDAFGGNETTVSRPEASQAEAQEEAVEEQQPASDDGTRSAPVPLGTMITSRDWTVIVDAVNSDAGAAVAEASEFNEPAPAGSHYVTVTYTTTYTGEGSSYAASVGVDLVTASGNVVNSYDSFVLLGDSIGLDELFAGASASGSVAFVVPDGEEYLVRVRPGVVADDVFVSP